MASCRAVSQPRAAFDHDFYEIQCLETHASDGLPGTNPNTTISFLFADPNTTTSTTCAASFLPTTQNTTHYPTKRTSCTDKSFGWSFVSFDGIEKFTLSLSHGYQDSA
ncbi:MAG: hypothetical protein M1830_009128 [Pleopsidium flavum]|nr:MAG: hypothetical protein M1830_009128 [Pleopsidium flavum]